MANTKGSDNPFPSVLFEEHVDPTNPASGFQRLFVDTDHVLKLRDSAGTVTTFGAGFSDPMTTRGDIIIRDASNVTARLGRGSASQVLTSDGTDVAWATPSSGISADLLPWTIDVDPFMSGITSTNWSTINADSTSVYANWKSSSGAQNAEIGWDVVLAAGTWDVEILHHKSTDRGIYTVRFDAVDKGTIDGYAASISRNQLGAATGITVATTAKIRLTLKMATKNASSSSYFGHIGHVQLRRTA